MRRVCSDPDCGNLVHGNGLCKKHYMEQYVNPKGCSISTCPYPHLAHGWCGEHLRKWEKYGDPLHEGVRRKDGMTLEEFDEWFWRQLKEVGECLEWKHGVNKDGYGILYAKTLLKTDKAHRAAWMLTHNTTTMPEGKPCVLHSCDNPPCCNPAHLRAGTQAENAADRARRRRASKKVTEDKVIAIRLEYATGTINQKELAAKYGISQSMISLIAQHRSWKHVP